MKIVTVFLAATLVISTINNATQSVFYGSVQFPLKIKNPLPLPLFFKGGSHTLMLDKDTTFSRRGAFEIYEDRNCQQFHLLITEKPPRPNKHDSNDAHDPNKHNPNDAHDIEFLEIPRSQPHKLFKLTRASKTREVTGANNSTLGSKPVVSLEVIEYWEIEQLNHEEDIIKIPDNTIIFLMNPDFITTIVSEPWKPDDIYIKLPVLHIDDTIDEKKFHEASTRMILSALDLSVVHKKITKTTKPCAQNRVLAVQNPLNCYVSNYPRV